MPIMRFSPRTTKSVRVASLLFVCATLVLSSCECGMVSEIDAGSSGGLDAAVPIDAGAQRDAADERRAPPGPRSRGGS